MVSFGVHYTCCWLFPREILLHLASKKHVLMLWEVCMPWEVHILSIHATAVWANMFEYVTKTIIIENKIILSCV